MNNSNIKKEVPRLKRALSGDKIKRPQKYKYILHHKGSSSLDNFNNNGFTLNAKIMSGIPSNSAEPNDRFNTIFNGIIKSGNKENNDMICIEDLL